jgi:hypothetical protein
MKIFWLVNRGDVISRIEKIEKFVDSPPLNRFHSFPIAAVIARSKPYTDKISIIAFTYSITATDR